MSVAKLQVTILVLTNYMGFPAGEWVAIQLFNSRTVHGIQSTKPVNRARLLSI